jgi:uncharacterized protein (TIGR02246 family)
MKHLLILAVGICMLISVPAIAGQGEDEAAIREAAEKIVALYNSHNAKALVTHFDDSGEFWDGTNKGRAKLEEFFTNVFNRAKNVTLKQLEEIGIVFITPDVAIHKVRRQLTGMVDVEGNQVPDRKEMLARVFVKKNGQWLLAAWFTRPIEE